MSKRKNRIISLNLCLDRGLLNIGNHQFDSHKLSTGKSLCRRIPLPKTSPINSTSSSNVTFQFILSVMRLASATVHFLIFLSIASSNKTRKHDSGLLSIILLVANAVGPGLMLSMFCCCKRPRCTWEGAKACQTVPSFPIKS